MILASDDDKISQYGVIDTGISDHCMVYCTRKVKRVQIGKHNNVKLRSLKGYSKTELLDRLSKVSWSCVLDCDDVNIVWNNFRTVFVNIIDSIAPLKETRLKQRSEPWIDDTILTNIKNRDQLLSEFKKHKNNSKFNKFKKARNHTQRLINTAKTDFFKNKLEEEKTILTLKDLASSSKTKSSASNIGLNINF